MVPEVKKFLPRFAKFTLMQQRNIPKYEENSTNRQLLYLHNAEGIFTSLNCKENV